MEVNWLNGQVWLLVPDLPDLEYTLSRPSNSNGYSRIIIDQSCIVRFRESPWYKEYIFGSGKIGKIYVMKGKNMEREIVELEKPKLLDKGIPQSKWEFGWEGKAPDTKELPE